MSQRKEMIHNRLMQDRENIKLSHWKHIFGVLITSGLWLVPYAIFYICYLVKKSEINSKLENLENTSW